MLAGLLPFLSLLFVVGANLAHADRGYWPLDSDKVPAAVREAAKSVYRISVPAGSSQDFTKEFIRKKHVEVLKNMEADKAITPTQKMLAEFGIQNCLEDDTIPSCTLFRKVASGSVFGIGPNSIGTAFHNIESYIFQFLNQVGPGLERIDLLFSLKIPGVLTATDGSLHKVLMKIDETKLSTKAMDRIIEGKSLGFTPFDAVVLKVEGIQIPFSVKLADKRPAVGEPLFAIGFPIQTTGNQMYDKPDSDGNSFRVVTGPYLNLDMRPYLKVENEDILETIMLGTVIFGTNCTSGMSGGPIVNDRGEIVGVLHSSYGNLLRVHGTCAKLLMKDQEEGIDAA